MKNDTNLRAAGYIAKLFINSKLTPLFVIVSFLLGFFAIVMTPKEEEPQIKVPMIDIVVPAPGFSPAEVEKRITNVLEREMTSLLSVKHVYSTSAESAAIVTVRFDVGQDLETSLVKVHHKVMAAKGRFPKEAMDPIVKSYTIDDVPFYAITFHSKNKSSAEIREKIYPMALKLQEISGISEFSIIGGERRIVRIQPNFSVMEKFGVTLMDIKDAIDKADNQYLLPPVLERKPVPIILAGSFINQLKDIETIPVGRRSGTTLKLKDVASITQTFDDSRSHVFTGKEFESAVTLTFTKKMGQNATTLSQSLHDKMMMLASKNLKAEDDIQWLVTRDYGETAKEKSDELLEHLFIATFSVMVLIALTMGFRVSLVVGIAVPVTLAMTLFVYYLLGHTLNRVTLFALIFSIGILVDDAIVVVENIYRHLLKGYNHAKDLAIVIATDEVGNPTILATLTVIVAIMPMAFVGGLMGPYMRPIPIGASLAMLFSLLIAFIVTPWAAKRLIKISSKDEAAHSHDVVDDKSYIARFFRAFIGGMINKKKNSLIVFASTLVLFMGSIYLVLDKKVKVKMLPFDNKSEFQVLVDFVPGTTLEETKNKMKEMVEFLYHYSDVKNIQTYIGTAAPFNFSGMVKHTFMRQGAFRADLQVNLLDKHDRKMQGHEFVKMVRIDLNKKFGEQVNPGIKIKLLEIPPGPPVMSTLLGEVYHSDENVQRETTKVIENIYKQGSGIVEVDTSYETPQQKMSYTFDREAGAVHGIPQLFATSTLAMALGNFDIYQLHTGTKDEPVFIKMMLPNDYKKSDEKLMSMLVPSMEGDKIPLKQIMKSSVETSQNPIMHKDLKRVSYVMAEVAGEEESPVYAIFGIEDKIKEQKIDVVYTDKFDESHERPILKWDGEMDITLEVFKDLGIAFFIAVILIMILVIGQYNSFITPLIIVLPIPITLIGIIPGHLIMNSFFTATSMIGFIAGAGITVRNSIILVDFINQRITEGSDLKNAVIESTIVRFRPILLTALAVVVAALVILFDPIFQGLAISLMFGAIISSLLSIPLVPVLYYWFNYNKHIKHE